MTQVSCATVRVAVIVGSVRQPRVGRVIADWFAGVAAGLGGLTVDFIDLADVTLPMSDTRPGGCATSPIADRLALADAYVIVTPEYNHSFPAVLKNAIDWHYLEWKFKPVAFVSYGAASGGIRAVEQLRLVFAELYATTTRTGVVLTAPWNLIGSDGAFAADDRMEQAAGATLAELLWWARALRTARLDTPYPA
jgi:NAD(P)H-dependent FMN reductase